MEITALLPNAVNPVVDTTDTSLATSSAASDFESFLTLLTAQLENQDPMSPLDSTEFVAQLASFSSVEQQIGTNERLDTIVSQTINGDIAAFGSWIGRKVSMLDGTFRATGEEESFSIEIDSTAASATAVVLGSDGREIRRIPVDPTATGAVTWDGKNASGVPVSGEDLSVEVEYFREGALAETRPAYVATTVLGIRGSSDGVSLDLADGRRVSATAVATLEAASSG